MKKRSLHHRPCRTAVSLLLTCLLLFALLPTAFAAKTPAVSLTSELDRGQLIVRLYFDDAIGLKSCDLQITYDPDVLAYSRCKNGEDAEMANQTKSNYFASEISPYTKGLKWSCYFKTELTDAETFANDARTPGAVQVNAEHFEAQVFYFDVKDLNVAETTINVIVTNRAGVELHGCETQISLNPDAPQPTARLEQLSSEDDLLVFGLYLDDAIGLEAWNLQIGYDPAVLELRGNIPGKDAAAAANLKENYLTSENYEMETGKLLIGGYFVNALGAAANPGETVEIDAGHFELLRLTFRPVNAAAIDTPLTVRVTYTQGLRLQGESLQVRRHNDHTFGDWTVTKEPTCEEKGIETRTCTFCGETETREVDATGHSFGEWTATKAATCVDQGTETRVCAVCKKTETREVDATGAHSFGEWKISREPTCADGVMVRLCGVCGATETKPIPAVSDHSFGAWTETKAATATEEGEETRSCTVCGATETRAIPKKPAVTADNIGDVDRDGKITASDARLALRAAVGLEIFDEETTDVADADRDEKITASDARLILRAAVGLEDRREWLKA